MRKVLAVVVDGLGCLLELRILPIFVSRVGIAVILGKVAAGDLHLDLVPLLEDMAHRPQVHCVLIDFFWSKQLLLLKKNFDSGRELFLPPAAAHSRWGERRPAWW